MMVTDLMKIKVLFVGIYFVAVDCRKERISGFQASIPGSKSAVWSFHGV